MTRQRGWQVALTAVLLTLGGLGWPAPVAAHCDSMDGPVVKAAQSALEAGEVAPVLVWVRPEDEAQIRRAFQRALEVRQLGDEAQGRRTSGFSRHSFECTVKARVPRTPA